MATERGLLNSPTPAPREPITSTRLKNLLCTGAFFRSSPEQPAKRKGKTAASEDPAEIGRKTRLKTAATRQRQKRQHQQQQAQRIDL